MGRTIGPLDCCCSWGSVCMGWTILLDVLISRNADEIEGLHLLFLGFTTAGIGSLYPD